MLGKGWLMPGMEAASAADRIESKRQMAKNEPTSGAHVPENSIRAYFARLYPIESRSKVLIGAKIPGHTGNA